MTHHVLLEGEPAHGMSEMLDAHFGVPPRGLGDAFHAKTGIAAQEADVDPAVAGVEDAQTANAP
ncbi:hypothetical protein OG530_00505 [Streptomyces decoyicus]|uniref:hypothetical protein n=1 Tax=Streptomyces decoyicus TaxID=249567 RepID=UPI002E16C565